MTNVNDQMTNVTEQLMTEWLMWLNDSIFVLLEVWGEEGEGGDPVHDVEHEERAGQHHLNHRVRFPMVYGSGSKRIWRPWLFRTADLLPDLQTTDFFSLQKHKPGSGSDLWPGIGFQFFYKAGSGSASNLCENKSTLSIKTKVFLRLSSGWIRVAENLEYTGTLWAPSMKRPIPWTQSNKIKNGFRQN